MSGIMNQNWYDVTAGRVVSQVNANGTFITNGQGPGVGTILFETSNATAVTVTVYDAAGGQLGDVMSVTSAAKKMLANGGVDIAFYLFGGVSIVVSGLSAGSWLTAKVIG